MRRTDQPARFVRGAGGVLRDADSGTFACLADLAAVVGAGRRFSVLDEASGRKCTFEVLAEVLAERLPSGADGLGGVVATIGSLRSRASSGDGGSDG